VPELPEVETTRRGIATHLEGRPLSKVVVRQPRLRWPVEVEALQSYVGKTLKAVERRGKYLRFCFAQGELLLHLGMSGSLRVLNSENTPGKHDHIDLHFGQRTVLRFNDPRRFGCLLTNEQGQQHPLLRHLGPEPLTDEFSVEYLYEKLKARNVAIKTAIMDARLVVGVGNIYAQEALFRAGIHPARVARRISRARVAKLHRSIVEVLIEAIAAGGSTLRDFTRSDGKPGYFQHAHQVYGRAGEGCLNCSSTLKQQFIAGRSSVYCPQCQR